MAHSRVHDRALTGRGSVIVASPDDRLRRAARQAADSPGAPSSLFERPGHAELWTWEESGPALSRIDLATGAVVELVRNVDSVDHRAATDDIVTSSAPSESQATRLVSARLNDHDNLARLYVMGTSAVM